MCLGPSKSAFRLGLLVAISLCASLWSSAQAPASEDVHDIHEHGLKPPRAIDSPNPSYSEPARKAKVSGDVILEITVTAAGGVRDVEVIRALGYGLDEKAMEAVRRWKFQPAIFGEKPVAVRLKVAVQFKLY